MEYDDKAIGRGISVLYRHAQAYIANQLKPYGLGSGQYTYLLVLYKHDGMSQEELSSCLMIDKGTTARAIEKLEKAGYVTRQTNPNDRRAYNVFLTDKAREIKPVLMDTIHSWNAIMVMDLVEEEKDKIGDILHKMVNSTVRYVKEEN